MSKASDREALQQFYEQVWQRPPTWYEWQLCEWAHWLYELYQTAECTGKVVVTHPRTGRFILADRDPMRETSEEDIVEAYPIIFSDEMVRAILDGRKTQTRRVVTAYNSLIDGSGLWVKEHWPHIELDSAWVDGGPSPAGNPGPYLKARCHRPDYCDDVVHRIYPRLQPGDRLWVKETWTPEYNTLPVGYRADCAIDGVPVEPRHVPHRPASWRWKPSMFMPRLASCIMLEVVDIWPERVQDISAGDAEAEGIKNKFTDGSLSRASYVLRKFSELWDFINAKRGYGWDVNPWVWVLKFRMIEETP